MIYNLSLVHNGIIANFIINYLFELMGGQPPRVFFPLFPWMTYPLVGVFIGHYLKQGKESIFKWMAMAGFLLLFIPFDDHITFYRTNPTGTLVHTGIALAWIYLWHLVSSYVKDNFVFSFLSYLSRNITSIYFIQWVLIMWIVPVVGYQTLSTYALLYCIIAIMIMVLLIQRIINLRKLRLQLAPSVRINE